MRTNSLLQLTQALVVSVLLFCGPRSSASSPTFQPLHEPGTGENHPGKFVWADLFTTDPVAATKFYTGLFGWTAHTIDQKGKAYTVFSNGSHPVAGLAPRNTANKKRPSRWIAYIAVADIKSALAPVAAAGGVVRAPARDFPDRGIQAIITDAQGSPVGLLQSTSGDSREADAEPGDWNWFELYAQDPVAATVFYTGIFHYTAPADDRTERKNDYLLTIGGYARAGIAPLPERADAQAGWLGVVRVVNLDEALTHVTNLGGEILVPPRATAYESRFAVIADPTGGTIGLVEYEEKSNPIIRP